MHAAAVCATVAAAAAACDLDARYAAREQSLRKCARGCLPQLHERRLTSCATAAKDRDRADLRNRSQIPKSRLHHLAGLAGRGLAIDLEPVVAAPAHHGKEELGAALVPVIHVECVVVVEERRKPLDVDGAAKPLEAVVEAEGHLAMLHGRARAHASKGDAVDLIVGADDCTRVPNSHVAQAA